MVTAFHCFPSCALSPWVVPPSKHANTPSSVLLPPETNTYTNETYTWWRIVGGVLFLCLSKLRHPEKLQGQVPRTFACWAYIWVTVNIEAQHSGMSGGCFLTNKHILLLSNNTTSKWGIAHGCLTTTPFSDPSLVSPVWIISFMSRFFLFLQVFSCISWSWHFWRWQATYAVAVSPFGFLWCFFMIRFWLCT